MKEEISDIERFELFKQIQKVIIASHPFLTEASDEKIWEMVEQAKQQERKMADDEEQHKQNHIDFAKSCKS